MANSNGTIANQYSSGTVEVVVGVAIGMFMVGASKFASDKKGL